MILDGPGALFIDGFSPMPFRRPILVIRLRGEAH
jgi:hypothetical protein